MRPFSPSLGRDCRVRSDHATRQEDNTLSTAGLLTPHFATKIAGISPCLVGWEIISIRATWKFARIIRRPCGSVWKVVVCFCPGAETLALGCRSDIGAATVGAKLHMLCTHHFSSFGCSCNLLECLLPWTWLLWQRKMVVLTFSPEKGNTVLDQRHGYDRGLRSCNSRALTLCFMSFQLPNSASAVAKIGFSGQRSGCQHAPQLLECHSLKLISALSLTCSLRYLHHGVPMLSSRASTSRSVS